MVLFVMMVVHISMACVRVDEEAGNSHEMKRTELIVS